MGNNEYRTKHPGGRPTKTHPSDIICELASGEFGLFTRTADKEEARMIVVAYHKTMRYTTLQEYIDMTDQERKNVDHSDGLSSFQTALTRGVYAST